MKVYIYYLINPMDIKERFHEEDLKNFSSVLTELEYDSVIGTKYNLFINGICRYLYAFTDEKTLAKSFENLHNMDLFNRVEKNLEYDDYIKFSKEMDYAKLSYENDYKILLTRLEEIILTEFYDELEIHLSHYAIIDYSCFNKKYILELDKILYTLYFQLNGPDDEFHSYNFSFGLTPEGSTNRQIFTKLNVFRTYYNTFKIILK